MRKWIALGLIACFALIFIFHEETGSMTENKCSWNQRIIKSLDTIEIIPCLEPVGEIAYNPAITILLSGYMDGIEFGIGTDSAEIIEEWGEPDIQENFMGGLLLSYGDIYFFTDGLIQDDRNVAHGEITGILYTGDHMIYSIQKGMAPEQVEEILGKPDETYTSVNSELFSDDNTILKYYAGRYSVTFEVDALSKEVRSISLWKEEE